MSISTRFHLHRVAALLLAPLLLGFEGREASDRWSFSEISAAAGLNYEHGFPPGPRTLESLIAGGVACGDIDGDGFDDLYVVRGGIGPNLLFRNTGSGHFEEIGTDAGVALSGGNSSGPLFADLDGDGDLDLLVGGVDGQPIRVFANRGDGRFDDFTVESGLELEGSTFSAAAADYDRDGDLDLFLTHWNTPVTSTSTGHLFSNDGAGRFTDVSNEAGIAALFPVETDTIPGNDLDLTFTPNFADVDSDGWPDLLLTSDFGTSQLLRNTGIGRFEDVTPAEISDENGMGAAVGDFDGDLDLDWFVSSIYDESIPDDANWGASGNRLYQNDGDFAFSDVTDEAGVREGFWGWGACFADFDLDGNLDLFHVNGFRPGDGFADDPARLFVSNGNGSYSERSKELGIADRGNGRGVVCFDFDRDGDVDVFVANNDGPPRLFRNDLEATHRSTSVRLRGPRGNSQGIGARVYLSAFSATHGAGGNRPLELRTQMREVRAGSNYVSQNPAEAIFGLGDALGRVRIRVEWPDGETTLSRHRAGRPVIIEHSTRRPSPRPRWRSRQPRSQPGRHSR